jgi:hypothetical protein
LSIVLSATTAILTVNIINATEIKNSYIASGLAQEGMEVVRNVRDSGWFAGTAFNDAIPDGSYRVQWNSTGLIPLGANPPLLKDGLRGIYAYDAGTATPFKRTISIVTAASDVEKIITVTVSWNERGIAKSVSAEDHLFNWRLSN